MTGYIPFSNDTAFEQLDEAGVVVTARPRDRTTGETWCSRGRGKPAVLDVRVEEADHHEWRPAEEDHPEADLSGFGDSEGWREAIRETHGELADTVYVYKVTKLGDRRDDS